MQRINQKLILLFSFMVISTISICQSDQPDSIQEHELGVSVDQNAGRILPGIQYYFGLKRNQQLGANLSYFQYGYGEPYALNIPRLTLEYRFRKNLFAGLNVYVAPLIEYNLMFSNLNGVSSTSGQFGLGMKTGLEYDFSQNRIPLILGVGIRAVGHYEAGRLGSNITPSLSLRIKL